MKHRPAHHSVTRLTVHLVWAIKYRYHVLTGDIQVRCRQLLMQICDAEDVRILSGVVSKDHIYMHIEYPPKKSISDIVKRLKGRSSGIIQKEYSELRKRYWGRHLWANGLWIVVNRKCDRGDGAGIHLAS